MHARQIDTLRNQAMNRFQELAYAACSALLPYLAAAALLSIW